MLSFVKVFVYDSYCFRIFDFKWGVGMSRLKKLEIIFGVCLYIRILVKVTLINIFWVWLEVISCYFLVEKFIFFLRRENYVMS